MTTLTLTRSRVTRRDPDRYKQGAARWIVLLLVGVTALLVLVPFAIMLMNAFKSPTDYSSNGPLAWPSRSSWTG